MTDPLKEKLKAEALTNRPTVTPLLHAQIMHRIQNTPQQPATTTSRKFPLLRLTSLAAALALTAFIFLEYPRPVAPQPQPEASLPTAADLAAPFTDLLANSAPTAESLDDAQYQNLDKDAKSLAHFLANQIPSLQ